MLKERKPSAREGLTPSTALTFFLGKRRCSAAEAESAFAVGKYDCGAQSARSAGGVSTSAEGDLRNFLKKVS